MFTINTFPVTVQKYTSQLLFSASERGYFNYLQYKLILWDHWLQVLGLEIEFRSWMRYGGVSGVASFITINEEPV